MAFDNVKNNLQRNSLLKNLALIAAAGANGLLFSKEKVDKIIAAQSTPALVEVNTAVAADAKGNIQVRATADGAAAAAAVPATPATPAAKPTFTIEKNIAIPEKKRGGRVGQSLYPFDSMEVGDSFLIPASADKPNPEKSMTSTVSAATRRYSKPAVDAAGQPIMETVKGRKGKQDSQRQKKTLVRKFEVRAVDGGARVFRTL